MLSEVLLKRTTARAAAQVYPGMVHRYPTLESLHQASTDELARVLAPLGLQRQRAQSLHQLAEHLIVREDGRIPQTLEQLLGVPGLGQYSARAVLSFAFDVPVAVVDSNVERIVLRVFRHSLPRKSGQRQIQAIVDVLLAVDHHREFNLGMIDLGALVCRPSQPLCNACPMRTICDHWAEISRTPSMGGAIVQPVSSYTGLDLGSRLRQIRQQRGLSQLKLSQLSGVTKFTIIRIETGRIAPRASTLNKLARALGAEVSEIMH